ncbi:4-phosphoerythronate dehydrogenase [Gilvimarinus sp. SDUM040013]|uniref:Erythronate-4-phosphate dehydrogenase n=1 Tax=Gilvimarinus gilvus TaxID=3058038 RepID=A0ABU4S2R5_9GAMM|nr:4-phosphoerythronate dehydrogenase [Gilvimarinus sp. SDUM040013]MDO3385424.1 4-phosphoerythronate dehydrogenase [Gilvimarinus sp. SDUM040013]MDX6851315.1 4-phosphoerythronate dehydrogenase [Gilvimarinus sp. SDUM040013]
MKIVADENIPLAEAFFESAGEVVRLPGRNLNADDVHDADALLVRSVTRVDEALLAGSKVKFVGTCTIGMDHLDQAYLNKAGITFDNAPGCNANSVVEYVYAALCRLGVDWRNRSVGIIGCGNVGGALYRALKSQGVECRCYDPLLSRDQNPDLAALEEVLQCDIVSMHTPLTTEGSHPSRHMMGYEQLNKLRDGAVLLNCGRGAVIDNQALSRLLDERDDLQVVLDVWEWEPEISVSLLHQVQLASPHIAGYSYDGKLKGTSMIYQAFCRHFGLNEQTTLTDVLPATENNRLTLPVGDVWQVICKLIEQVYDIHADDRALRDMVAASAEPVGVGFDRLRKQYPVRREFNNYIVPASGNPAIDGPLQALGFTLESR